MAAIGLDSAEWSLLEPMMDDGELPHLSALRRRSAVARLHNADYRTGLVWEQFLTGRGAAGSGRCSPVAFDPSTYEVVKVGARPVAPFFRSVPGHTVAFDVPFVSLASTGDATAVTAWGAHDPAYPRAAAPAGLLREIEQRFGPHPAFDNDYEIVWNRPDALERFADALVVGARRRADVASWLLRRCDDWRLFLTVLSETHSAAEQLWHGVAPDHPVNEVVDPAPAGRRLREVYRAVDDAVGRILAALPDDTTVVMFSLHGATTNDVDVPSMVLLPELLHRLALGRPFLRDPERNGVPAAVRLPPDVRWHEYVEQLLPADPEPPRSPRQRVGAAVPASLRAAYREARRVHRGAPTNGRAGPGSRLGAMGLPIVEETDRTPDEIGVPSDSLDWQLTSRYRPAWPDLPAFAMPTFQDGRVRVNLEGREHNGVVALGDYARECGRLEDLLRQCRDVRTGEPVVEEVVRLRADDPCGPEGPDADLLVIWSHAVDALTHPDTGTIGPFPFRRMGTHRPGGFAMVAGPGVSPAELGDHDALDLPATVTALAGGDLTALEGRPLPLGLG